MKHLAAQPPIYYMSGNAVRFYGHANSGNGSELIISLDPGYELTYVEFIYPFSGQTNGNVTIKSGGVILLDNVSKPESQLYDMSLYPGSNPNEISIQNTTTGSSTQFRLERINIYITKI